jgi:ribA/ribD-fused uncharacterized protein
MQPDQIPAPDGTPYPPLSFLAKGGVSGQMVSSTWQTVEHYFQAMKFPTNAAYQERIFHAPTPERARTMGRDRAQSAYLRKDWEQIKERVLKNALVAKFRQNPRVLALLQSTGKRPLIEASPTDTYWGAGASGKGENRMGKVLEEVRELLKNERVDQTLLRGRGDPGLVADALVSEMTGGAVQLPPGGVYMFINNGDGGSQRGSNGGRRRSRAQVYEPQNIQEGSGAGVATDIATGMGSSVEVTVEKLN